jgi:hypothetical protein
MPKLAVLPTAGLTAGTGVTMPGAGEVVLLSPVVGLSQIIVPLSSTPQIRPHQSLGRGVGAGGVV